MSLPSVFEVPLVTLRRAAALLFSALVAAACRDPSPTTGTLVVSVTGLPTGAVGAVRVTGPNQFFELVPATTTLENLVPGQYIVSRDPVLFSNARYAVVKVRDTITVTRGRTESATVPYEIASGSLTVNVDGLPTGVLPNLSVKPLFAGPTPVIVSVSGTTIPAMTPGDYEILAATTSSFVGDIFNPAQARYTVTVSASLVPAQANVTYALASGTLSITVNGLPSSNNSQSVTVTGPGGYQARTSQSAEYHGLSAGTYSIAASNVNGACPDVYTTSDALQSRAVTIGQTATATISYTQSAVSSANLNLKIDNVYVTQATQNYAGTVPLITGKTALVRIFGSANQCNLAKPKVRVTVSGGTPVIVAPQEDSVRTSPNEGALGSSWNVIVPAASVQLGMTVVAEIDPSNEIVEANEGDNRFPGATGTYTVDVRTAPVVGLRLVPVAQTVSGVLLTGAVSLANVDQFLEWPRKLHPVGTYDVDIRDTYTTTSPALQANSGSTWTQVLSEIRNLQQADLPATQRYYYGIARVSYNSGIAGIAYVPGKAALGWDYLPTGSRIMAHELGHNYGQSHSPCGNPEGVDLAYPTTGAYAGGKIGAFGWDPVEGLKAAEVFTDVMGYCNTQWISDYMYVRMLNNLLNRPQSLPSAASNAEQPSLLIWGRIENGVPLLEPTFEISATPRPIAPGPHRVTATDANGAELFSVSFAGEQIADLPGQHETFSFTVPLSALRGRNLASLSLTARGKTVTSVASSDVAADPGAIATRAGPRAMRVRWDATRFPVVMVRNPVNGQVLSFARGGDATIVTSQTQLDLNFSNRLRSSRRLTQFK